MLTKINMYIIKVKDNFYTVMYKYWMSEAEGFAQLGRYDEAEECRERAMMYLVKEFSLLAKTIKLA